VKGKPVILLTPHFVGMDVGGSWISQQVDAISVYSTQKNRYLSEMLFKKRIRFGNQRIYSRQQGLRPIVKALREGCPFFYLPDQDQAVKDGTFISFFGVPTATITTVASFGCNDRRCCGAMHHALGCQVPQVIC